MLLVLASIILLKLGNAVNAQESKPTFSESLIENAKKNWKDFKTGKKESTVILESIKKIQ